MAGRGKRPPQVPTQEVSDERKKRAFSLRLQGWSQKSIADELGITQQAVCEILYRLNKESNKRQADFVDSIKLDQTARIEAIKEQLYRCWENSPKDTEAIKYISEIRKQDEAIRKIWGAEAPGKQINTNLDFSKMSDDELQSFIDGKGFS